MGESESGALGACVRLRVGELAALIERVLRANGCDAANARAIAANMARVERDGSRSHGVFRLEAHVAGLRAGTASGVAQPSLERLTPASLRIDAAGGYAPLAQELGLPALAEAARANGVAALAIRRCIHLSALWPEVETLAEAALAALALTSSPPYVAPPGGRAPLFGTNPIAFAWPRPGRPPLAFDQASAAMARGEVMVARDRGEAVPDGVGMDAAGAPSRDPAAILDGGAQLAFGGYKGANLALMVDLLAGPLIGEVLSVEAGEAGGGVGSAAPGGELIVALDPARLGGDEAAARAERLFALVEGGGGRLPGARRLAARAASETEGIALSEAMYERMLELAAPPGAMRPRPGD